MLLCGNTRVYGDTKGARSCCLPVSRVDQATSVSIIGSEDADIVSQTRKDAHEWRRAGTVLPRVDCRGPAFAAALLYLPRV
jgi:hypothetical protein